ncbi:hypothetical protein C8Q79DRAFT_971061 [Trametes meyenii]|nr:hypothetical protein C8Q79DRAFT_971061 [Trametes meyenii]
MSAVELLCRRLVGGDYADIEFHRQIYDLMKSCILPTVSSPACPPLPVLVYATRSILEPTLVFAQLPSLLRLLVHLEILRNHAANAIHSILRRDAHSPSNHNGKDNAVLSHEERETLEKRTKLSRLHAQRKVYRKIIDGCCLLHIHHVWRTYDETKDLPLTDHLIAYFPVFFTRDPELRPSCEAALVQHPWHHDITKEELTENSLVGAQATQFVLDAAQYAEDPRQYCVDHQRDLDTPFNDLFPPPDVDKLSEAIMRPHSPLYSSCDFKMKSMDSNFRCDASLIVTTHPYGRIGNPAEAITNRSKRLKRSPATSQVMGLWCIICFRRIYVEVFSDRPTYHSRSVKTSHSCPYAVRGMVLAVAKVADS